MIVRAIAEAEAMLQARFAVMGEGVVPVRTGFAGAAGREKAAGAGRYVDRRGAPPAANAIRAGIINKGTTTR